jgi:transcriptional regulator with XRE-family HTH domain
MIFKLHDKRYELNGAALKEARARAQLTLKEVANKCGWSIQYQWRLENGLVQFVCEATKNVIECALT